MIITSVFEHGTCLISIFIYYRMAMKYRDRPTLMHHPSRGDRTKDTVHRVPTCKNPSMFLYTYFVVLLITVQYNEKKIKPNITGTTQTTTYSKSQHHTTVTALVTFAIRTTPPTQPISTRRPLTPPARSLLRHSSSPSTRQNDLTTPNISPCH